MGASETIAPFLGPAGCGSRQVAVALSRWMWLPALWASGCDSIKVAVIIRRCSVAGHGPIFCWRPGTHRTSPRTCWLRIRASGCGSGQVAMAPGRWLLLWAGGCSSNLMAVIIRKYSGAGPRLAMCWRPKTHPTSPGTCWLRIQASGCGSGHVAVTPARWL